MSKGGGGDEAMAPTVASERHVETAGPTAETSGVGEVVDLGGAGAAAHREGRGAGAAEKARATLTRTKARPRELERVVAWLARP